MTPALDIITVVIPTLNEAPVIQRTLSTTRERLPAARILVADGGSCDGTLAMAGEAGADTIVAGRGRGVQCHAGARASSTEWLLFLHADTILPPNAAGVVAGFISVPAARVATFRLAFDQPGTFLRVCCWFTRFDSVFTRFGDQGILIRRSFYEELGGFPPWPLFEDVALLQRARRLTRVVSLPAPVTTSARRFHANGHLRQQWLNARLLVRYLAGTSPHALADEYRLRRQPAAPRPQTPAPDPIPRV